jgi:DNA-binding MarR family transcriptional regulator
MEDKNLLQEYIDAYTHTLKRINSLISEPMKEFGISFDQYLILKDIIFLKDLTLVEIAKKYDVTKSASRKHVSHLVKLDYITQFPFEEDRRKLLLKATDKGIEIEKICRDRIEKRFDEWMTLLGDQPVAEFLSFIKKFNESIVLMDRSAEYK